MRDGLANHGGKSYVSKSGKSTRAAALRLSNGCWIYNPKTASVAAAGKRDGLLPSSSTQLLTQRAVLNRDAERRRTFGQIVHGRKEQLRDAGLAVPDGHPQGGRVGFNYRSSSQLSAARPKATGIL
jgi:hypothetical protein